MKEDSAKSGCKVKKFISIPDYSKGILSDEFNFE